MNFKVVSSIGGLFEIPLTLIFCSALLLFPFHCFSQAKATHATSFKCELESFFIRKFSDYECFLDNLNPEEAYEKCGIQFPHFKDFHEFSRFIELPSLETVDINLSLQKNEGGLVADTISNVDIEENSGIESFSDSNIRERIQGSFSKMKTFHISIRKTNNELVYKAIESFSNEVFNAAVNTALNRMSAESKHDFIKEIGKKCSCFTEEDIGNSKEDCSDIIREYIEECDEDVQNYVLMQLLMILFIEKICQLFIRTLPSNLSTLEIAIDLDIPICSNLLKSISHLNDLDMIDLSKDSFTYSNRNLIHYLSETSNCKWVKLRNLNLIRQFFEFLHENANAKANHNQIELRHGDTEKKLNNTEFERLTSLNLYFITDEPFDTKQVHLLQNLPLLESLYVEIAHKSTAIILKNLREVANSTSLKKITFFWPTKYKPFFITIQRPSINDVFDENRFDIKFYVQKRIEVVEQTLTKKTEARRINEVKRKFIHLSDRDPFFEDDLEIIHLRRELDYFDYLVIFFKIEDVFDSVHCKTNSESKKNDAKQYIAQVRSEICNFLEPGKEGKDVIAFMNAMIMQLILEDKSSLNLMKKHILISLESAINEEFGATKYNSQQGSKSGTNGNFCIPFKPFHFLRKQFFGKKKFINKRKAE